MRVVIGLLGLAAVCAGSALATGPKSSMPDISRLHYERQNCHGAYDVVVEAVTGGGAFSAEERAWAESHEALAKAGKPCAPPPESLARRAVNRMVVTPSGQGRLAEYHRLNDPEAMLEAAISALNGKWPDVTPADGLAMLQKAAAHGEPAASFLIAALHTTGSFGKPGDYASALPFIEAAAKAGHVDALASAGGYYKEGLGTKADKKKAFAYYRQAAERGHIMAAVLAFNMIQAGEGTKKDFELAYRLGRNLADRGEVYGAVMASSALLQRRDVLKHEDEILYWMDTAIRDGDDKIKSEIGKLRPRVVAAFQRANAPPEYRPRERKLCPLKRVCRVSHYTGVQSCTTNVDYWNDCDG